VRCGTDITGFGLLGHLHKLALGSGVAVTLFADLVPVIPGVERLLADGFVPGGTGRNLDYVDGHLRLDPELTGETDDGGRRLRHLLADPQTSGGLAICVGADRVADVLAELRATGHPAAAIGEVDAVAAGEHSPPAGTITVRRAAPELS
jgi:selenide, water dikinase